jgi:hypothetical protein
MALSLGGNMAALGHAAAGDEILKNHFANYAFEHFEIASYRSLIVMAETVAFQPAIPLLQMTLKEEEAMAAWVGETLPEVTRKFMTLKGQGRDRQPLGLSTRLTERRRPWFAGVSVCASPSGFLSSNSSVGCFVGPPTLLM